MTLREAEELFKELNGEDPYLIWHEAGEKTLHEYHDLKIPFATKRAARKSRGSGSRISSTLWKPTTVIPSGAAQDCFPSWKE